MHASVFIGVGSNLSDPVQQVTAAISELKCLKNTQFIDASSLYETSPMGPQDQPNYINAVAHVRTSLKPIKLLDALQTIEQQHNRTRDTGRWGARTLDLDILDYNGQSVDTARLTLPHPGIAQRSFVLYPLQELDAELHIQSMGRVKDLIHQLDEPCPTIISPKVLEK